MMPAIVTRIIFLTAAFVLAYEAIPSRGARENVQEAHGQEAIHLLDKATADVRKKP